MERHVCKNCNHKPTESIWEAAKMILIDKNYYTCKYCGEKIKISKMKTKMALVILFCILNPPGYVFYFFTPNKAFILGIILDIVLVLLILLLIYKYSKYEKI